MFHRIVSFILYRVCGWQLEGKIPRESPRQLFVFLPHTSNWDFVIGWMFIRAERLDITIFGKDAFYFFPFTALYRFFRVVPIKRHVNNDFVAQAAALYDNNRALWTAMAPEGTRSYTGKLRSGYYYFARQAGIDIVVVGVDFKRKTLIVRPPRKVLNSFEEDANNLMTFSQRCVGKKPEQGV